MEKILKQLARYFIQGVVLIVPLAITLSLLFKAIESVDSIIHTGIHGMGILIIVTIITLAGFIGSTFIATPIVNYFHKLLDKIPLVKVIYSSIKDLLAAFVGKEKKFNKPVKVKLNTTTEIYKLGFITQESLEHLGIKDMIAVYLPHSYNFSGDLYIVPRANVTPIVGSNSSEIMKFIVSGGVASID
jgi:uncharacterized membrane protein